MPLGPAEYAIVLAAMSALRIPSDDVTSIFGAPARIATPTPELATLTRLSAVSLPCLMRSSICAAGSMTTSATSPSAMRLWTAVTPPQVVVTLWPVAFSKPGTSSVYGSRVPGEPMTLISAALALPLSITALTAASAANVATCALIVMAFLPVVLPGTVAAGAMCCKLAVLPDRVRGQKRRFPFPPKCSKTLSGQENHDRPDRQLRQLHLQPVSLSW